MPYPSPPWLAVSRPPVAGGSQPPRSEVDVSASALAVLCTSRHTSFGNFTRFCFMQFHLRATPVPTVTTQTLSNKLSSSLRWSNSQLPRRTHFTKSSNSWRHPRLSWRSSLSRCTSSRFRSASKRRAWSSCCLPFLGQGQNPVAWHSMTTQACLSKSFQYNLFLHVTPGVNLSLAKTQERFPLLQILFRAQKLLAVSLLLQGLFQLLKEYEKAQVLNTSGRHLVIRPNMTEPIYKFCHIAAGFWSN